MFYVCFRWWKMWYREHALWMSWDSGCILGCIDYFPNILSIINQSMLSQASDNSRCFFVCFRWWKMWYREHVLWMSWDSGCLWSLAYCLYSSSVISGKVMGPNNRYLLREYRVLNVISIIKRIKFPDNELRFDTQICLGQRSGSVVHSLR